jgi:hypothetical protein
MTFRHSRRTPHFTTFAAAAQWVNRKYSGAEMVALHVAIARDDANGRSYEV